MMDKLPNFNVHLITHPISLIAFGVAAVVVLAFIGGPWYAYVLVLAVIAGGIAALVWYPHLGMESEHQRDYWNSEFRTFRGDVAQLLPSQQTGGPEDTAKGEDLADLRVKEIEDNRGLFLVHAWRPSEKRGQVADIIIRLQEHLDTSTRPSVLEQGKVESVRYELGRKFLKEPVNKRNQEDNFALEVSAYRPMLCVAEVTFNDGHPPVRLSRYIDFPTDDG
jgi:hypothetical protein